MERKTIGGPMWDKDGPYNLLPMEVESLEEVHPAYRNAYIPKFINDTATKKVPSSGGPSSYYDMPFKYWVTTNDQMEYLAENKWGKYAIHLKDIFKGLCRWGEKEGTDTIYDAKKIVYYGLRVLRMLVGVEKTREYIQTLLDDKQFGGK